MPKHTITLEGSTEKLNTFLAENKILKVLVDVGGAYVDRRLKVEFEGDLEAVENAYNVVFIHDSESFAPFTWGN